MNRIQKLSQDLLCQRLKLQMGLDPEVDIEPQMLQAMWAELQKERRVHRSASTPGSVHYAGMDRAA